VKFPAVVVKASKIHGKGLFVRAALKAGTPVIEYDGERITPAEARRRYPELPGQPRESYLLSVDSKTTIDGGKSRVRFANHSCDPSCELLVYKKRVFLIALKPMKSGDEITYDYNLVIHGDVDVPTALAATACNCGAPNCRRTMLRIDDDPVAAKAIRAASRST
jgi:uncharacterized protein